MKILVSGGHLTPALAFIEQALSIPENEVVFVGREYSQPRLNQRSHERAEVEKLGVKFLAFESGKVAQLNFFTLVSEARKFLISLRDAKRIISQEKPTVFVSFGGFLAVPLAFVAWRRQIPIITHEQTPTLGLATRLISVFARKVAVSHQETLKLLSAQKGVFTGNPIRASLLKKTPRPEWLKTSDGAPILFVTGGNQGSKIINQIIGLTLPQLTKSWRVIHQCGNPTVQDNYLQQLKKKAAQLPPRLQEKYFVFEWISEAELSWVLQHAALVISRSGANTTLELTVLGKPALFIPLPLAHQNEQQLNAQKLVQAGMARIINQSDLTAEVLLKEVAECQSQLKKFTQAATEFAQQQPTDGASQLYQLVATTAHSL